jgi:hypothetical protein
MRKGCAEYSLERFYPCSCGMAGVAGVNRTLSHLIAGFV